MPQPPRPHDPLQPPPPGIPAIELTPEVVWSEKQLSLTAHDANVYFKALTLACEDMPGDTNMLVSRYIDLARAAK